MYYAGGERPSNIFQNGKFSHGSFGLAISRRQVLTCRAAWPRPMRATTPKMPPTMQAATKSRLSRSIFSSGVSGRTGAAGRQPTPVRQEARNSDGAISIAKTAITSARKKRLIMRKTLV